MRVRAPARTTISSLTPYMVLCDATQAMRPAASPYCTCPESYRQCLRLPPTMNRGREQWAVRLIIMHARVYNNSIPMRVARRVCVTSCVMHAPCMCAKRAAPQQPATRCTHSTACCGRSSSPKTTRTWRGSTALNRSQRFTRDEYKSRPACLRAIGDAKHDGIHDTSSSA